MEVKNRKNLYIPYKEVNNKYVTIMWDYKPIVKTNAKGDSIETPLAIWQEHTFDHIPELSEIKKVIMTYYNELIDDEILTGFTWNDMHVWLSSENQFNYKAAYDLAVQTNGSILPVTFKFGDDEHNTYHVFSSLSELSDFYIRSVAYIQETLKTGWETKDSINWELYRKN